MASALQQQLQKLSAPQTDVYKADIKKKSFLFQEKDVGPISREVFFQIGIDGYNTLVKLNPKFEEYESLFDEKTKNVQRFITDVESNKALDEKIGKFLLLVSQYFSHSATEKALEWLLQRYNIHEMNVDAVMKCILPYYDTLYFSKVLKALEINRVGPSGEENMWQWLSNAKKFGVPPAGTTMYNNWKKSAAFRRFCNSYLLEVLDFHKTGSGLKDPVNFYVTTVIGGLSMSADPDKHTHQVTASDDHINSAVSQLHVCLKSSYNHLVSGAYLIIMQLSLSFKLKQELWMKIMVLTVKYSKKELYSQLSSCLETIAFQQEIASFDCSLIMALRNPECGILSFLSATPDRDRIAAFLVGYVAGFIKWSASDYNDVLEVHQENINELLTFITNFKLETLESYAVIRNLLEASSECETSLPALELWLPGVLEQLDTTYPDGFDKAAEYFLRMSDSFAEDRLKRLSSFMSEVKSNVLASSITKAVSADIKYADETVAATGGFTASGSSEVVAIVDELLTLLDELNKCKSPENSILIAHDLLDKSINALKEYKNAKKGLKSTSRSSLRVRVISVAHTEGRILFQLFTSIADKCLSLINVDAVDHFTTLLDNKSNEQPSILLAIKILHVLITREKLSASQLRSLLNKFGSSKLQFLACLWSWQPYLPHYQLISPFMQLWCLKQGLSILKDNSSNIQHPPCFVVSLLSPLTLVLDAEEEDGSLQKNIRISAMEILESLNTSAYAFKLQCDKPLLQFILEHRQAICTDGQSQHLLSAVRETCSTDSQLLQSFVSAISVGSKHLPAHSIAVVLFTLSQTQNKFILQAVFPMVKQLLASHKLQDNPLVPLDAGNSMLLYWSMIHFNSESIEIISESQDGWDVFTSIMNTSAPIIKLEMEVLSPQAVLLQQIISSKILQNITSTSLSGRIWAVVASAASNIDASAKMMSRLHKALKDVHLHASFILDQLKKLELGKKATKIREAQAYRVKMQQSKRKRTSSVGEDGGDELEEQLPQQWRQLYFLVELLCEVKHLESPWLLVTPLSNCLQEALLLGLKLTERVVQQLLFALHHLVTLSLNSTPSGIDIKKVCSFSVETVVQIMRESLESYTHRRALLLLSLSASYLPEAVLHNSMAIFTFMGEGLLQRDDEFSYQVIHTTIATLVPILVSSANKNDAVVPVTQVFVDALPDIPTHRRVRVFSTLAKALGPSEHLWLVIMLIVKGYILHGSSRLPDDPTGSEPKKSMPKELSFGLQLLSEFEAEQQVSTAQTILTLLSDTPSNINLTYKKHWTTNNPNITSIKLQELSAKQLRHLVYTGAGFLAQLFISEGFLGSVQTVTESKDNRALSQLHNGFQKILSSISSYVHCVNNRVIETEKVDGIAYKFWTSLQRKLLEVFEGVCSSLQPQLMLIVTKDLLSSPINAVKLKGLELLRSRLLPTAEFFSFEQDYGQLVPFIEQLNSLGGNNSMPGDLRQVALSALQMLLRFLSAGLISDQLQNVTSTVLRIITDSKNPSSLLTIQAILVVAECITALRTESISILPELMPSLLKYMAVPQTFDESALLLPLSSATALCKVLESIPRFLSPYMKELTCQLCTISFVLSNSSAKESKLASKLAMLGSLLQKNVQPVVLLPALQSSYSQLSTDVKLLLNTTSVLDLISGMISCQSSKELSAHLQDWKKLLSHILATRHNFNSCRGKKYMLQELEERSIDIVTKLMLSFNQNDNLSLLSSITSWVDKADSVGSLTTFYRLVHHLSVTFKSLFIKAGLADNVFNHAVKVLMQQTSAHGKDAEEIEDICELLPYILKFLSTVFSYDTVNFVSEARFEIVVDPLLEQLKNRVGGDIQYRKRIDEGVKPAFVNLCTALRNDAVWGDLNKKMLLMLREDLHPQVQCSILSINRSIVEVLEDDWLQPLLTDTLRYVTEAMESSHPKVKNEARALLKTLENIAPEAVREQLEV